jgi:translation initiation factor IF-3
LRVNYEIRVKEVRVIGLEGEQLGILPTREAIKKAEEVGYDLVEVAPTNNPPVCRIMDYGKYKYEQSKKLHAQKLHQKGTHVKEVKLRPYTSPHDLEVKLRHVKRFLEEGNKVKITLMFRGREMAYQDAGKAVMDKVIQNVSGYGSVEQQPTMEGRNLVMLLTPKSTKS